MSALHKLEFGYYPKELEFTSGPVSVSTLPALAESREKVERDEDIRQNWIYPGNAGTHLLGAGVRTEPYPERIFGLPRTHVIEHASADDEAQLKFHVWALSFFTGMRLTTEEAGFLDATPIKPGELVDFVVTGPIEPAAALAEKFWTDHRGNPRQTERLAAAIHALFMAQYPRYLQFEQFIYIYTALDACFAVLREGNAGQRLSHAGRLEWMCNQLNIPAPPWALPGALSATEVSALRNDAMHEALFVGAPLGFRVEGAGANRNLTLEMQKLTCRILAATLGVSDENYLRSALDDRQRHGMRLN